MSDPRAQGASAGPVCRGCRRRHDAGKRRRRRCLWGAMRDLPRFETTLVSTQARRIGRDALISVAQTMKRTTRCHPVATRFVPSCAAHTILSDFVRGPETRRRQCLQWSNVCSTLFGRGTPQRDTALSGVGSCRQSGPRAHRRSYLAELDHPVVPLMGRVPGHRAQPQRPRRATNRDLSRCPPRDPSSRRKRERRLSLQPGIGFKRIGPKGRPEAVHSRSVDCPFQGSASVALLPQQIQGRWSPRARGRRSPNPAARRLRLDNPLPAVCAHVKRAVPLPHFIDGRSLYHADRKGSVGDSGASSPWVFDTADPGDDTACSKHHS